jgi:glycosyltransferase involved in cell wall biosynthesis
MLLQEQYDAMFIFTDPRQYIWLWEMEDEIRQVCPIVYWHVWDNDPYPNFNDIWYKSTDLINCLSWKTYEMVKSNFPEKTNYIPHAWPKELVYPLESEQINSLKKQFFGNKSNWFMPIWVNRNAHRKMPNDLLMGWKMFLDILEEKEGHKNAILIMHTDPNDIEGPNLQETTKMLNIKENVAFSINKLNHDEMNQLYNMSDCVVNISKAEGFGLSILTGLQIGKPCIALKTGGMIRQINDYRDNFEFGVALEPIERSLIGSQMVPFIYEDIVSKKDLANGFYKIYKLSDEEKQEISIKSKDYVNHEFNFEKIVYQWDKTMEQCILDFKYGKMKKWEVVKFGKTINEFDNNFKVNKPKSRK